MSAGAALDLRYPIGGLFVVLGAILAVFGAVTRADTAMYVPSGGVNINLWWGLVMLVVGALFLLFARRGTRRDAMTAAGAATEAREKALGLES
jgi:membrane-bound ClpP family serine protease